jgi:hypothetical protein
MPLIGFYPPEREGAPPPPPTHYEVLLPSGRGGWVPVTAVRPFDTDHLCYARTRPVNRRSPPSTRQSERLECAYQSRNDLPAQPSVRTPARRHLAVAVGRKPTGAIFREASTIQPNASNPLQGLYLRAGVNPKVVGPPLSLPLQPS